MLSSSSIGSVPGGGRSAAGPRPNTVAKFLMGWVRAARGRFALSLPSITKRAFLGVVVSHDLLERGMKREGVRREPARDDRGLHTALVETAVGPVAGERHVVQDLLERRDAVHEGAGQSQRVPVARIHVGRPELLPEPLAPLAGFP